MLQLKEHYPIKFSLTEVCLLLCSFTVEHDKERFCVSTEQHVGYLFIDQIKFYFPTQQVDCNETTITDQWSTGHKEIKDRIRIASPNGDHWH